MNVEYTTNFRIQTEFLEIPSKKIRKGSFFLTQTDIQKHRHTFRKIDQKDSFETPCVSVCDILVIFMPIKISWSHQLNNLVNSLNTIFTLVLMKLLNI